MCARLPQHMCRDLRHPRVLAATARQQRAVWRASLALHRLDSGSCIRGTQWITLPGQNFVPARVRGQTSTFGVPMIPLYIPEHRQHCVPGLPIPSGIPVLVASVRRLYQVRRLCTFAGAGRCRPDADAIGAVR